MGRIGFKVVKVYNDSNLIAGVEFMMSTQALFCRLCKVFSGDASCAEHHLKSEEHYKTYQVQSTKLLPPASEGWGKVLFSVCLSVHTSTGGGSNPGLNGGGRGVPQVWMMWGGGSQGTPSPPCPPPLDRTAERALATRRAVSLLRSRRRTFLF